MIDENITHKIIIGWIEGCLSKRKLSYIKHVYDQTVSYESECWAAYKS